MQILGIDVGGTGIKFGVVDTATGTLIGERERILTPKPATPKAVGEALRAIVEQKGWRGPVGIGFPAAIVGGTVRTAANIDKSFLGLPIAAHFAQHTGCPVFVANDADAAGLAEMRFGAGLFHDGRLLPNTELGHIHLDNGKEAEPYASEATRVTKKLKWKDWGPRLGHVLCTLEHLLWPELIVIGGGVSKKLEKYAPYLKTQAPVVAASFLNEAGIVGAALIAENGLRQTPAAAPKKGHASPRKGSAKA